MSGTDEHGMFGVGGSGDTSGFGGLVRRPGSVIDSQRPYGGDFDEVVDALEEAYPGFGDAIERVVVDRGELTLHIVPAKIAEVCQTMRDDEALRYELCSSVSGVDYLSTDERRLHVAYHLTSMTYRRRIRLECALSPSDPHLPSVTYVYPTADWQERETYDALPIYTDVEIVLMDIMMPEMDGMETMRVIRKIPQLKNLPIVAVTAKAMKGDREKCIEAGAWDYLSKPVDPQQLLAVLRAWLHR